MEVNSEAIRQLRQARGWTQQHLADACDVNSRTIQRVEREGTASNETVHALCAVFEIRREQLSVIPVVDESQLQTVSNRGQLILIVLALVLGILLGCTATYVFVSPA